MTTAGYLDKFLNQRQLQPLAATAVLHDYAQDKVVFGQAAIGEFMNELFHCAFPNADLDLQTAVELPEVIVVEFTMVGKQEGGCWSLPYTGRQVNLPMTLIGHLQQGVYQRIRLYYDAGSLLRQLGLAL